MFPSRSGKGGAMGARPGRLRAVHGVGIALFVAIVPGCGAGQTSRGAVPAVDGGAEAPAGLLTQAVAALDGSFSPLDMRGSPARAAALAARAEDGARALGRVDLETRAR